MQYAEELCETECATGAVAMGADFAHAGRTEDEWAPATDSAEPPPGRMPSYLLVIDDPALAESSKLCAGSTRKLPHRCRTDRSPWRVSSCAVWRSQMRRRAGTRQPVVRPFRLPSWTLGPLGSCREADTAPRVCKGRLPGCPGREPGCVVVRLVGT